MAASKLNDLQALVGDMEGESATGQHKLYEVFADQDSEFHARIALGSGNTLIVEALARLHTHLHIFRLATSGDYATDAVDEHGDIERALSEHDPDKAEMAMRQHIENSFKRLIPFMD